MKKPKHFKRLSAKEILFIAREAVLLALVAFLGWLLVGMVTFMLCLFSGTPFNLAISVAAYLFAIVILFVIGVFKYSR